jgi:hypothetical protein
MRGRVKQLSLTLLSCLAFAAAVWAQGTYTAASCNQSDVNAVINGPTHTAVDGDVIQIPSGSCTWTSGVTVPSNIGITVIGSGSPSIGAATTGASSSCQATVITSNYAGGYLFTMRAEYENSVSRISCIEFLPESSVSLKAPIAVIGTCTSSGCPNMRMDNLTFPSSWVNNGTSPPPDDSMIISDNMFGVLDHNTVGDTNPNNAGVDLVNVNNSAWLGVGQYGDNSWTQADTFGAAQTLYLENNTFNYAFGTDMDGSDSYGDIGGGRAVCRFNTFNNVTLAAACTNHGTESTGRPRGGRQLEFYGNTLTCSNTSQGCPSALGQRSGTSLAFGNSLRANAGSWFNNVITLGVFRSVSLDFDPWSGQGFGPYDTRDGASATTTSTLTGVSGTCTYGSCTLTDSAQSWTTNQYAPGSNYYTVYDVTSGAIAGIASNNATQLTLSWCGGNSSTCYASFTNGDSYRILGTTLYVHGTYNGTSGSTSFSDSTQTWSSNQWVSNGSPYILANTTQGWACEIASNTATTITCLNPPTPNWANQSITTKWNSGEAYGIVRTMVFLDAETRYGGTSLAGSSCGTSASVPTCVGSNGQTLDPAYEFDDTHTGSFNQNPIGAGSATLIANRDFYMESVNQAAQSSPTSPFTGSSGNGHGTLANRPTSCTPSVGYWATDQGSWNQSGSGGQGELFVCTATNTWSLYYTPYTYPHPLDSSGTAPSPPTGLTASPH